MQQTAVVDFRFRVNAFFVKAREGGGRGDAVETVAVIKQTKFHKVVLSSWLKRVGNSSNAGVFSQRRRLDGARRPRGPSEELDQSLPFASSSRLLTLYMA